MSYEIDGRLISSKWEFCQEIAQACNFPPYFNAGNLDSLWDCLSSLETPLRLTWRFANESRKTTDPHTFDELVELMREAEQEFGPDWEFQLQDD